MFGNRVPHMLENDYTPHLAIDIFVKDLGIVLHESRGLKIPLHISADAHQQFLLGSAAGWGRWDDAAVIKIFEKLCSVIRLSLFPNKLLPEIKAVTKTPPVCERVVMGREL